ncbi:GLPGLI family protein [candidate division KSB1 bacterium]
MKRSIFCMFVIAVLLIGAGDSEAQEIKGGVVKYEQTTKYNFESVFNPRGDADPRLKQFLASLPKEGKEYRVLYFTDKKALYEEDMTVEKPAPSRELMGARERMQYMKPPSVEIEKVYSDFGIDEVIQQVMFMTRNFRVKMAPEKKAWKFTNKNVKVLDYTCMGAEMAIGDTTITAWFTSEVPVSTGPEMFSGLPGLVLAVEINGETAIIATSIELNPPAEGVIVKPEQGEEYEKEAFDKIVKEKIEEWEKTQRRR